MSVRDDDPFWVKCSGCGEVYTLMLATVCPKCWKWPKRDGPDRIHRDRRMSEEHYCKWHSDDDDCPRCGECTECGMCECGIDEGQDEFDE